MRYLWIIVVSIVMVTGIGVAGGMAQPATMQGASPAAEKAGTASTPTTVPDVIRDYVAALNAHDADRVANLYTEDAVVEQAVLNGNTFQGRDEIISWVSDNFTGLPNLTVTVGSVAMEGDRVTWEWVYDGDYTGQFPGAPAGEGQPVTLRGISVMELRDSLIQGETIYFDNYAFLTQIGVLPAPGTPVSPED